MAGLVFALFGLALVVGVPIGVLVLWQRVQLLMARLELLETRLATVERQATSVGRQPHEWQASERQAALRPTAPPVTIVPTAAAVPSAPPSASSAIGAVLSSPETRRPWVESAANPSSASASSANAERSEWEVVLGTSWLNKIGVLV